ncbi:MAG: hypothetical protein A2007_04725 [Verrucomicrobia bacterium GWC2_42_7]|nr:MAG: hypothetical protein A2007_04725 [Verrucomicrobia bacterium GWC2_42_7]
MKAKSKKFSYFRVFSKQSLSFGKRCSLSFFGEGLATFKNFGETAFSPLKAFPQTPSEKEIMRVTNF